MCVCVCVCVCVCDVDLAAWLVIARISRIDCKCLFPLVVSQRECMLRGSCFTNDYVITIIVVESELNAF